MTCPCFAYWVCVCLTLTQSYQIKFAKLFRNYVGLLSIWATSSIQHAEMNETILVQLDYVSNDIIIVSSATYKEDLHKLYSCTCVFSMSIKICSIQIFRKAMLEHLYATEMQSRYEIVHLWHSVSGHKVTGKVWYHWHFSVNLIVIPSTECNYGKNKAINCSSSTTNMEKWTII